MATETKPRGKVAPGKTQVNWRIREDAIDKLQKEADESGFSSVPALVNHILVTRYTLGKKGKK